MNNFCVLPFNSISIDAKGEIRQCCNTGGKGYPVDINKVTVDEVLNNEHNGSLRQSFLNDEKDPRCSRCWEMEDKGSESFRHWANKQPFGLDSIIPINKSPIINYEDIQYLDITLGNKCNLGCRMCYPSSSHLVARALLKTNDHFGPELIEFSRPVKDKILDLIKKSTNLQKIYLLGGEPLVNEFHDEILELLISIDRAKTVGLHYSTNLQIDLEKYFTIWEKFKEIDVSVSIDGTDKIYEYIRWPGSYQKIFNNLVRSTEYAKAFDKFRPSISITMQNLNVTDMYNMIDCLGNGLDLKYFVIPVHGHNHIEICPTYILEEELRKLEQLEEPAKWYSNTSIKYLEDSIIKSQSLNTIEVMTFFRRQKIFDEQRNQNLFATLPHFEMLADNFKIEKW